LFNLMIQIPVTCWRCIVSRNIQSVCYYKLLLTMSEDFTSDLGSFFFALETPDPHFFVTCNRCVPVKNILRWSAVVLLVWEIKQ
jgi:hypothetical protein